MGEQKENKRVLQGAQTKKRIIKCAAELFMEKGYRNVSVDEIVAKAGSSKGSFYTHFTHKFDLVYALVEMLDEVYMAFDEFKFEGEGALDRLRAFITYVFEIIGNMIGLDHMTVIYSTQIETPETRRLPITPERAFYIRCSAIIEEGKKRQEIRTDISTPHMIRIITTVMRGVIYDWCFSKGEIDLPAYGSQVLGMMLPQLRNSEGEGHNESK